MNSSDKTKYRFAQSIKELMQTSSLDKITVTDIVRRSGLTRQTFYRNFLDKYDLVNWYFERLAQKSFKQMGISFSLRDGLIQKFNFIQDEKRFFAQAFQSRDCNSLVRYDYDSILQFYTNIIMKKTGNSIPNDIQFLLEMYCRGSIDMTVQWVTGMIDMSPEKIVDLLIEAMPTRLKELLLELQNSSTSKQ